MVLNSKVAVVAFESYEVLQNINYIFMINKIKRNRETVIR